jgi:hypothetical protein
MNFNDLYRKISAIDSAQVLKEDGHTKIEECGEMPGMMNMPHGMPGMPQPQQDSVSMNVSMNASGKGGIRDLMNVLRNLEDTVGQSSDDHYSPVELPSDGEIEIDGPSHEIEIDNEPFDSADDLGGDIDEPEQDLAVIDSGDEGPTADKPAISPEKKMKAAVVASTLDGEDGEMDEEWANGPNVSHQSIDYMTKTLAGGANKSHQQAQRMGQPVGVNPMKESGLLGELANLYQEVKLRESSEKKTMSRAAKGNEKYGKDGMKALAKAGREGKSLDPIKDKFNKYKD